MKMNIKAKDFADKANLEKTLSTKLKKPLMAVKAKLVESLPFCYEVDYFGEGRGFMTIGVAKEIDKLYKTKRSKGQGLDENGKAVKIDKKKVGYGKVSMNANGQFEFCVMGGMMKPMQAKKVIKSIPILKKTIGDNFIVVKGEGAAEEDSEEGGVVEQSTDGDSDDLKAKLQQLKSNFKDFKANEVAASNSDKNVDTVKAAIDKGREVANEIADWLQKVGANPQLAKAKAGATKAGDAVKAILDKLTAEFNNLGGEENTDTTTEESAEKEEPQFDYTALGKEIIGLFQPLQKEFNREKADEVNKGIKEWLKAYKESNDTVKKAAKDIGAKIQKVAAQIKKTIAVDNKIEKDLKPLFNDIDKYNNMVDPGNDKGKKIKTSINKSFENIKKQAASIKDNGLIDILKKYINELQD